MAGPYELFKTDEELESSGVTLNYGTFKIVVARAGGGNKKYVRVLENKIRPYRRAIQAGTMDDATDRKVMAEVYAEAVILGWSKVEPGENGPKETPNVIPGRDGEDIPFTKANVVMVLTDLPDLFADIISQAQQVSTFRQDIDEVDAKN